MTSPTVPTFWSNAPRSGLRNLRLGVLQRWDFEVRGNR